MATKKISELTNVASVQDTDLLIVETSEGTRAVKKSDLLADLNTKQTKIKTGSVTFTSSGWGYDPNQDWYWQIPSMSGVSANDKIDLQPDATVIKQMLNDGVTAMYVVNSNGTPVGYTLGSQLTTDVTVQFTLTEVE